MVDIGTFGYPNFYRLKNHGWEYNMSANPKNDKVANYGEGGGGGTVSFSGSHLIMHPNGATSFEFGKNEASFNDSIGGCNMSFKDCLDRGYAFKKDDARDVEVIVIAKFSGIQSGEHFSMGGPTGHHTGNNCCQGFSYMISTEITDDPVRWRYRKETSHANYDDSPEGYFKNSKFNLQINGLGRFVGLGYLRYNSADNKSVFLENYFNPDPHSDPLNWTQIRKIEDKKGKGWGIPNVCNGDKDQVGLWSNAHVRLKTNSKGGTIDFEHIRVREIDPFNLSGGDGGGDGSGNPPPPPPPPPPPDGTLAIQFRDIFNINSSPAQSCSGLQTGVQPLVLVYDEHAGIVVRTIVDDAVSGYRTRMGELIVVGTSAARLFGKKPRQVVIPMKKIGSPGGNVICAIWDEATDPLGGNKVVEIGTLAVNTLDTSFKDVTFYNEVAPLSLGTDGLKKGWTIGIEYLGTSANDNIAILRNDNDPIDGSNSITFVMEKVMVTDPTTQIQTLTPKFTKISKADTSMKVYV